ncbi:hypothetical protein [Phyllobacterium brassicacearum]|uniref:hypothetical protein n=1 Tax=Phyllobacterium brassicacearum TaxID=314235 RepID=UPI0010DD9E7B|nr:hypothetical protein [Phyllobacterium brassicacearum]TDQ22566.1 hypothetical protein DEV91_11825 [Phyllobacterium brassicacearum]
MRIALLVATALLVLAGCASSGNVSPLVFCDAPGEFKSTVTTHCTPRLGHKY